MRHKDAVGPSLMAAWLLGQLAKGEAKRKGRATPRQRTERMLISLCDTMRGAELAHAQLLDWADSALDDEGTEWTLTDPQLTLSMEVFHVRNERSPNASDRD